VALGEDWDGSDGWHFMVQEQDYINLKGYGVYARVFDWAGNWIGAGSWYINLLHAILYLPLQSRGGK
jgi:hypothetical protein